MSGTHVVVFAARPGDRLRAGRTMRLLKKEGMEPEDATGLDARSLARRIAGRAVWLLRAGAFPIAKGAFVAPPSSASGKPLGAIGVVRASAETGAAGEAEAFSRLLAATGGDFGRLSGKTLPPLASLYCEPALGEKLAARLAEGQPLEAALGELGGRGEARLVRFSGLDVFDDERMRVLLAVTSLQQGGAERMVIDLAETLGACGVRPLVAALGRPTRATFPAPEGSIDLAGAKDRVSALYELSCDFGADLVHGHLLTGDDVSRLARLGVAPILLTIHNTRAGWPAGLERIGGGDASLLVACSLSAEADLAAAGIPIPTRTAWNGIDLDKHRPTPALREAGARLRKTLGFGATDLMLVAVANPRPQKRLERLPFVLAALRLSLASRGILREARLVVVGDADPRAALARESIERLRDAISQTEMDAHVKLLGSMADVAPVLAASDVLVSASAHEGLSLAHLEALAMGLPVVATDAGGTREIAAFAPSLSVVSQDASAEEMAEAVLARVIDAPQAAERRGPPLPSFRRETMAERYSLLYRRALAQARGKKPGGGVVLITNNFSTGGAQSSARRLLLGLSAEVVRARAVVLEEQERFPTPGRRALMDAGIDVLALPPAGDIDAARAVSILCDWLDEDPPEAVLLWNALAPYKLLIADALLGTPIFDVSPGEMYFSSLSRHFDVSKRRPGFPYRDARDYGSRLAGVIVKYAAEARRAEEVLGAKTFVVPNGVVLGKRPPPRGPGDRLVIGTAARLSPQKKLEDLFDALRLAGPRLPPHVLYVAGGPERGSEGYEDVLRKHAEGLSVEFLGEVDVTAKLLSQIDLFAMISEPAGCPNASLEAMAAGLPVIATDVGGASEQVEDFVTGRLVPRGDVSAFAEALVALGRDAEKRAAMGFAGRLRAEERFDARRMVADYRRILFGGGDTTVTWQRNFGEG